jgi:hypothetical protein
VPLISLSRGLEIFHLLLFHTKGNFTTPLEAATDTGRTQIITEVSQSLLTFPIYLCYRYLNGLHTRRLTQQQTGNLSGHRLRLKNTSKCVTALVLMDRFVN